MIDFRCRACLHSRLPGADYKKVKGKGDERKSGVAKTFS
ncbi:Hypothetical protein SmN45_1262 [Serratia marcescens]|nr:Hypothetical protein SmN45_1262 [Serratia marcescens]CDJ75893.1 Hpothetical protein [Serratia marcescens SMB2099]